MSGKLFITGGSGYVGRNLIRHFVSRGVEACALVRTEHAAAVVRQLGAECCLGDLHDARLAAYLHGCEALIHAAADTDHVWGGPAQERTNVEGTAHLLEAARQAGVKRALYLSTESVLLDGGPLVDADETHPYPQRWVGSYSRTKAEAERLALAASVQAMRVCAIRPRFVWGRDDTTALPQLVQAANAKQLAWIDGGDYLTSTTHIANLCHGVELALERGRGGQVYFVTDGAPVVFREFISELLGTQGIVAPGKTVPRWVVRLMARLGDAVLRATKGKVRPPVCSQQFAAMANQVTLNTGKAASELAYVPVISVPEGLAEMRGQLAPAALAS